MYLMCSIWAGIVLTVLGHRHGLLRDNEDPKCHQHGRHGVHADHHVVHQERRPCRQDALDQMQLGLEDNAVQRGVACSLRKVLATCEEAICRRVRRGVTPETDCTSARLTRHHRSCLHPNFPNFESRFRWPTRRLHALGRTSPCLASSRPEPGSAPFTAYVCVCVCLGDTP